MEPTKEDPLNIIPNDWVCEDLELYKVIEFIELEKLNDYEINPFNIEVDVLCENKVDKKRIKYIKVLKDYISRHTTEELLKKQEQYNIDKEREELEKIERFKDSRVLEYFLTYQYGKNEIDRYIEFTYHKNGLYDNYGLISFDEYLESGITSMYEIYLKDHTHKYISDCIVKVKILKFLKKEVESIREYSLDIGTDGGTIKIDRLPMIHIV